MPKIPMTGKLSSEEKLFLEIYYPVKGKVWCAEQLNRTVPSIRQHVFRMGLILSKDSEFFKEFQSRAALSKVGKKRPEHSIFMKELRKKTPIKHTQDGLKRISEASIQRIQQGKAYRFTKSGWFCIGGKTCFFRSSWEVVYARYLEFLKENDKILEWKYEPRTFWFEKIKRGVRSYTPDFLVIEKNSNIVFHEVKGYLDSKSKTKLKRMKKYYPEFPVILIEKNTYKSVLELERMYPKAIETQKPNH